MPKFWKKLTYQEILSYPVSHEKSFLGNEVRFGLISETGVPSILLEPEQPRLLHNLGLEVLNEKVKGLERGAWLLGLALLAALSLSLGCGNGDLNFPTEYQAVFLDNGQVFFGKLSDAKPPFLTLRDVYYVQTLVEQDQKKTANILVKRGSEWHNPDFMRINTRHVVVIEPVGPDSRVAQLIREAKTPPAPKAENPPPPPAPAPAPVPPVSKPGTVAPGVRR